MSKKPERRSLEGTTATPPETTKRKKQYNPVAGYRIPRELKEKIANLADELQVSSSDLVQVLFKYALDAYERGDLKLTLKPEKYRVSIKS
jgi:hypothetical protein